MKEEGGRESERKTQQVCMRGRNQRGVEKGGALIFWCRGSPLLKRLQHARRRWKRRRHLCLCELCSSLDVPFLHLHQSRGAHTHTHTRQQQSATRCMSAGHRQPPQENRCTVVRDKNSCSGGWWLLIPTGTEEEEVVDTQPADEGRPACGNSRWTAGRVDACCSPAGEIDGWGSKRMWWAVNYTNEEDPNPVSCNPLWG